MLKITDNQYTLWDYVPLEYVQELSSGKSMPLLLRCICAQDQQKDEIVVKLSNNIMSHDAKCREIIAAFIANELGLLVAEPVLVHINQDTLLAFKDNPHHQRVHNAIGKNFGNKWAGTGYNEFVHGFTLNQNILLKALNIFIFDVLIVNPDRRFEKQNLKTYQDNIIIFDHESAFGFVFDIFSNPTPWVFADYDKDWIRKHLFYTELKKNYPNTILPQNIDNFMSVITTINAQFWHKAKALIPTEWQQTHNQIDKIQARFDLINNNTSQFSNAIKQILS